MSEFHPDQPCECGHSGREHRPSAVAPFGRGICTAKACGCRCMVIPGIPAPLPRYNHQPGGRYGLVVHRGRLRPGGSGEYRAPELVASVPTVSGEVAREIGHTLVEYDDARRLPFVYVDWRGGPMHGIYPDAVRIAGCGCGRPIHVLGKPAVVAEMTRVLQWVNQHTAPADWCELVPINTVAEPGAIPA